MSEIKVYSRVFMFFVIFVFMFITLNVYIQIVSILMTRWLTDPTRVLGETIIIIGLITVFYMVFMDKDGE